jgi:ankyrin repeat protein
VLSICSTLLVVIKPGSGSPVIQFAHFSVKEYLTSARLAEAKDTISRFHVSMTPAHTIVAQACLGVLLHLDENITKDSLKDFPLAEYAAEHWVDHARFEKVASKVQDGMKRLFDPSQSHLSVWVWIYDPEDLRSRSKQSERPAEGRGTPLHYAAVCGMHDIATFLVIEHTQDVNARGFDSEGTPLHVASREGFVELAWILLKHGADIEARDTDDWSPLERATTNGHVDLTRVLLEHGANVNARDIRRCTPLYWTSEWGKSAVVQVLLRHGADVTTRNEDSETPLHYAGNEEVTRLLLQHGADANALDIKNRTPLHSVSKLGHVGAAWALLEHGVDVNARDANNATPLHLESGPNYWIEGAPDVVRLLLQYNPDIEARDNEGLTPFMRATAEEHRIIMQLLLEHGAEDHRV